MWNKQECFATNHRFSFQWVQLDIYRLNKRSHKIESVSLKKFCLSQFRIYHIFPREVSFKNLLLLTTATINEFASQTNDSFEVLWLQQCRWHSNYSNPENISLQSASRKIVNSNFLASCAKQSCYMMLLRVSLDDFCNVLLCNCNRHNILPSNTV